MNQSNMVFDPKVLRELGEWAALGFYEALDEPWPRAYGRAYLRLYENMEVVVPPDALLIPFEPMPHCMSMAVEGVWSPTAMIFDHHHHLGLRVNPDVATERKKRFPQHAAFIDALVADLDRRRFRDPRGGHFGGYTHSNPDMRRVVHEGFLAMEAELDAQIAGLQTAEPGADAEPLNLLLAVKDFAAGARAFHARTVAALDQAASAASAPRRQKLELVACNFRQCFLMPSRTFLEGLLAVNFAWMLDGCDSLGRPDQVLGGLFEQDLAAGRLDLDFARALIDELFRRFEHWNAWNLQIGGRTPEGRDGCNALTREFIAACARNHFRRPNVAFRVTRDTPDELLDAALAGLCGGSGRPPLYNDDLYIQTLLAMDLGLTPEDAREFGFGGCTETMIAGLSNVGSLEGSLNLAKALELALHDGFDPLAKKQVGPHTGRFEDLVDFPLFYAAVKKQIQYLTDAFVAWDQDQLRRRFHNGDPKLARTMFTRDCVKKRKSFEAGGARYNWAVVSYAGIANLIDGLAAIKQCVFDAQRISRRQLREALAADFKGHEPVRQALLAASKFGNDDPEVDDLGAEVIRFAWEALYAQPTPRGGRYLPSCIQFTTYLEAGWSVGATPDGRRAGTALADSVGAVPGGDTRGPTALLNSVAKLPLTLAVGTPVLNLRFQKSVMETAKGRQALAALIRSFFERGGMQAQISVVSRKEMLAAKREPEKYRDLIVRIGGYSEYFVRLLPDLQDSVIARTEHVV